VAWRETSIRSGFDRKVLVIRSISGAMVAEKNSVWRVKGVRPKMRSISGMKPMSSIRSASSTTMIDVRQDQLAAFEMVEQAAGRGDQHVDALVDQRSCSLKLTPPISSALVSFTYLA
jgi:hypothetical protein